MATGLYKKLCCFKLLDFSSSFLSCKFFLPCSWSHTPPPLKIYQALFIHMRISNWKEFKYVRLLLSRQCHGEWWTNPDQLLCSWKLWVFLSEGRSAQTWGSGSEFFQTPFFSETDPWSAFGSASDELRVFTLQNVKCGTGCKQFSCHLGRVCFASCH